MKQVDILIIGAGAAGMAAAIGAKEAGVKDILVVERDQEAGGILNQCIHNGFGLHTFHEELSGPAYAWKMNEILRDKKINVQYDTTVMKIHKDLIVELQSPNGYEKVSCGAIIVATGSRERSAGAIGLQGSRGQGIYTAGCAQRYLNMDGVLVGKKVFILGSGDIGLIMARRMTLEGAKVIGVAEVMPYSNGLARNVKQCLEDFDIPLYVSHTVKSVHGRPRIQSITLVEVDENQCMIPGTEREIEVDCLLLSVGLLPENTLLEDLDVRMDSKTKGIWINEQYMSTLPGLFACGNALHIHDLVDYVSEEGKSCGRACAQYVKSKVIQKSIIQNIRGNGVGYVLPQSISGKNDVDIYLRVNNIYKNAVLYVHGNGFKRKIKKIAFVPSEMIKISISARELNSLKGDLVWEIKKCN